MSLKKLISKVMNRKPKTPKKCKLKKKLRRSKCVLECFYLRLLLINVHGPTSFEYLRTVNGQIQKTYQEACRALNLPKDDLHWDTTLSLAYSLHQIRSLFAIVLTTCYPSKPDVL